MDKVIGYKLSEQELLCIRKPLPMNMEQHNAYHMAGEILELRKEIAAMRLILDGAYS